MLGGNNGAPAAVATGAAATAAAAAAASASLASYRFQQTTKELVSNTAVRWTEHEFPTCPFTVGELQDQEICAVQERRATDFEFLNSERVGRVSRELEEKRSKERTIQQNWYIGWIFFTKRPFRVSMYIRNVNRMKCKFEGIFLRIEK